MFLKDSYLNRHEFFKKIMKILISHYQSHFHYSNINLIINSKL